MTEGIHWTARCAESSVDSVFRWLPRSAITRDEWNSCQLVAHRGCADADRAIYENTLTAFETARDTGAWGIELDVRWTLDDWPVVIHDPDTARMPGAAAVEISKTELDELRMLCPLVPRLEEVLERFCGKIHLMIELKCDPPSSRARARLRHSLAAWQPIDDFYLMSLDPARLRNLPEFPADVKLLIATTNTQRIFNQFKIGDFGGMAGHYLLLNSRMREYLNARDVPWGTGFVNSANLLAREIRAGARWVFSDATDELLRQRGRIDGRALCDKTALEDDS